MHSIVSLPAGVFLPYSGVKTNIIFFEKGKSTKTIRYYELNLDRKLTKNKPITSEDLQDMVSSFQEKIIGENSWFVDINEIRDYDISAKNPAKIKEIVHMAPRDILHKIAASNTEIQSLTEKLTKMIKE